MERNSELVNVLTNLQTHWNHLESDLVEITRDIKSCEELHQKYGHKFFEPLHYLKQIKQKKYSQLKEIIENMEKFNQQLRGGQRLLNKIEKSSSMRESRSSFPSSNIVGGSRMIFNQKYDPSSTVFVTTSRRGDDEFQFISKAEEDVGKILEGSLSSKNL